MSRFADVQTEWRVAAMKPKFEVGQVWRTREGGIAEILSITEEAPYPLMGKAGTPNRCQSYTSEGYFLDPVKPTKFDLVELATPEPSAFEVAAHALLVEILADDDARTAELALMGLPAGGVSCDTAERIRALETTMRDTTTPTRCYVAGPMTGLPDLNFPAFHAKAAELRARGAVVINPAELCPDPAAKWEDCMRVDLTALLTCDTIVMLDGWTRSRGATLEHHVAAALGMTVVHP